MGMRLNFGQSLDLIGTMTNGGTLKAFLDGGPTYDEFTIATNLAAAEFTLVVEVDGDRRVEITGQQMLDREAYDGRTATSGYFVFSFADALARTIQGEALTGLTTMPGQRILVSLELADSGIAGTETVTLYAETSEARAEQFRLYCLPEAVPVSQTGENTFDGFRQGTRPEQNFIRRIFNYGNITKLSVEQDRRYIFGKRELAAAVNTARLKRNGKTEPSSCYVLDPILKGNVNKDLLDTFSREMLRFTYTTGDSNDITALTEYVQDVRPVAAA